MAPKTETVQLQCAPLGKPSYIAKFPQVSGHSSYQPAFIISFKNSMNFITLLDTLIY